MLLMKFLEFIRYRYGKLSHGIIIAPKTQRREGILAEDERDGAGASGAGPRGPDRNSQRTSDAPLSPQA